MLGWLDPCAAPPPAWAPWLLIWMRRDLSLAWAFFGSVTFSTPFSQLASTRSASTSAPNGMVRSKRP